MTLHGMPLARKRTVSLAPAPLLSMTAILVVVVMISAVPAAAQENIDAAGFPYEPLVCDSKDSCRCDPPGTSVACGRCPNDKGSTFLNEDVCFCLTPEYVNGDGVECNPSKPGGPKRVDRDSNGVVYEPILCENEAECRCAATSTATKCGVCPHDGGSQWLNEKVCHCHTAETNNEDGIECNPIKPGGPQSADDIMALGVEPMFIGELGNVSVVACSASSVLLTSSVVTGRLLINLDDALSSTSSTNRCSTDGCGFLYRFAVSQEPANNLGSVRCPEGSQCFLVETKRASLGDVYRPEVLINAETEEVGAAELLEEIVVCDSRIDDTLSVRQEIRTSSRQALREYFDNCADTDASLWRKRSLNSGGCPFSEECDDNPEKSCYHCTQKPGSSCSNGCGAANSPLSLSSIPWVFDFSNSCCGHDYCYDSQAFSKQECDDEMFRSTIRSCIEKHFPPMTPGMRFPLITPLAQQCLGFSILFRALLVFAGDAFEESRRLQEAHLESCRESPLPEPTTVSDEDMFVAGMFTDPHLRTFDQLAFDCQASGEFILAKSESEDFMLQGRFSGQTSSGSVLTGIALQDGNTSRMEVSVTENNSSGASGDCLLQLVVDGVVEKFESGSPGKDGSPSVSVGSSGATITTARGFRVTFSKRLSRAFGCYLESFSVAVPASEAPKISGLLGTPNNDQGDDWTSRDGTVIQFPETRRDRLFQAAHAYCTANWCIRDAGSSLFSYLDGRGHGDFDFCDRPYREPDLSSASAELLALCEDDVECLVDGVVGGLEDASAGKNALAELEARFRNKAGNGSASNAEEVTLPRDLSALTLRFSFSWENQGDLDTSASWLGDTVGWGCGAASAEFVAWSQDDKEATGEETFDIDLSGSLAASAWSGSTEVRFGAGWHDAAQSLGAARIRASLRGPDGTEVPDTVLEADVNPGTQSGCANRVVVAIARLTEGEGGEGIVLKMLGV